MHFLQSHHHKRRILAYGCSMGYETCALLTDDVRRSTRIGGKHTNATGRRTRAAAAARSAAAERASGPQAASSSDAPPAKRPRGRPRKHPLPPPETEPELEEDASSSDEVSISSSDEGSDDAHYDAHSPADDDRAGPLVTLQLLHWGSQVGYLGVRHLEPFVLGILCECATRTLPCVEVLSSESGRALKKSAQNAAMAF